MENIPSGGIEGTKGVSNNTIIILILLALIMTVIGTWAVVNSIQGNKAVIEEEYGGGSNVGRVSFTIVPVEKYSDRTAGFILLNIEN